MQKSLTMLLCLALSQLAFSQAFITDTFTLHDASRHRDIPVKLYRPDQLQGTYPVIIFSHGLGGSRNAAPYLGEYLAANGYVCFFLQHQGSDESVWRDKPLGQARMFLQQSLLVPSNFINRAEDIPFMIEELNRLNKQDPLLRNHLDLDNIGMAGHSYGARSTMIAAGEKLGGRISRFKVPAIKAGLVLSPNIPERVMGDLAGYYDNINIPLFHMTGTNDEDPLHPNSGFDPKQRQMPYRNIFTSPQYLLVIDGATHATFAGVNRPRMANTDPSQLEAVRTGALAFFDAYLKHDQQRREWLQQEFGNTLNKGDVFEFKTPEGRH